MKNNKGFTLVELLAVIVVLSIVLGLTVYIALNAINKAKEKSYQVTINNIEKEAGNYLLEMKDKLFYVSPPNDEFIEYQCLTVQNLLDLGYLKNDIVDKSKVSSDKTVASDDYIYIERDADSKAITKTIYVGDNNDYLTNCNLSLIAKGNIRFISAPHFNEWSQKKTVTVKYTVNNVLENDMTNIKYTYQFENEDGSTITNGINCTSGCDDKSDTKVFEVTKDNVIIHSYIKNNEDNITDKRQKISNIDKIKPQIELVSNEKKSFNGTAKIDIKVKDNQSGINYQKNESTFTKNDIVVKIDSNVVESKNINLTLKNSTNSKEGIYEVTVNDTKNMGAISISIGDNKAFDKADNGNDSVVLNTNVYINTIFTVKYSCGTGATGTAPSNQTVDYGDTIHIQNGAGSCSKAGHTFSNWTSVGQNGTGTANWNNWEGTWSYINGQYGITDNQITLTASWTPITYTVKYSCGTGATGTAPSNQTVKYGNTIHIENGAGNCSKAGHTFSNWTSAGQNGTGTANWKNWEGTWSYINGQYGIANNQITLTASWTPITYTVKYSCGTGATGTAPSNQTVKYGNTIHIENGAGNCSKAGHTFSNWTSAGQNGTGTANWNNWEGTWQYINGQYGIADNQITLTAAWNPNNYYLDLNGYLDNTQAYNISGYGTVDIYINGSLAADDVADHYATYPYGTTYEIKDIKAANNHTYNGVYSGSISGTITDTTSLYLNFTTDQTKCYTCSKAASHQNYSCPDGGKFISDPEGPYCIYTYRNLTEQMPGARCEEQKEKCEVNKPAPGCNSSGGCGAGHYWNATACSCLPTGSGCFLAGTKVTTLNGYKDINKVSIGDMVLTYNEGTGINEYHKVTHLFAYQPNEINEELYTLTFDDKTTLQVSSSHRFYIKRNKETLWLPTKSIRLGDIVMYSNKKYHRITNIKHEELTKPVYNLSVENTHNYYVGNQEILVHNVQSCGHDAAMACK